MSRFLTKGTQLVVDVAVLCAAYWLAFLFRFEFDIPPQWAHLLVVTGPVVVVFQYIVLGIFGVPRFAWRYVNLRDVQWVFGAFATLTAILVAARIGLVGLSGYTRFLVIPLGVLAMNFILAAAGIIAVRAGRRIVSERRERQLRETIGPRIPTLLIGAGQAGVLVAREVRARPDLGIKAVGFLDDDPLKIGTDVQGLRVLGRVEDIERVTQRKRVRHALITIANASGKEIRRISQLCRDAGLETKIVPGLYEIVAGQANLSRIRPVAIEDLLGRDPVQLDEAAIEKVVRARTILVSGAGGSIGAELCRQVARFGPERILLVEKSETSLFEIHRELVEEHPALTIEPILADICNAIRMEEIFTRDRPQVVFHAAAYKHVPMLEWNPGEAVRNNIGGTRVLADLADKHAVGEFVMISTDKAVNPSSVMGASKRVAEIYVQALSQRSNTRFVAVRFGNVLGSAGSVIPIFKKQIERGGPVTVTHPDMRRYFMTISEACQLVLQAASIGAGGEIFVLDMGEPVKIVDLARDLIRLSGLEPEEDVQISFTGVRPGEKLFEELHLDAEQVDRTKHAKIYISRITPHDWGEVALSVANLLKRAESLDLLELQRHLSQLVPEYAGSDDPRSAEAV